MFRLVKRWVWMLIMFAGVLGSVVLWQYVQQPPVVTWSTQSLVRLVTFSPDGQLLASYEKDQSPNPVWEGIRLRRVPDGTIIESFENQRTGQSCYCTIESLSFNPNGTLLAEGTGNEDKNGLVRLRDVASGEMVAELIAPALASEKQGYAIFAWNVQFSPDGQLVMAQSGLRSFLWRVSNGQLLQTINQRHLFFAPDNTLIAVNYKTDYELTLERLEDHTVLATLSNPDRSWTYVQITPSGNFVATQFLTHDDPMGNTSHDSMSLWSVRDERLQANFVGHIANINAIAFSPDEQMVATASGSERGWLWNRTDRTVRVWRVRDGKQLHSFPAHDREVYGLAWSHDGRWIASGSLDGTIKLWQMK